LHSLRDIYYAEKQIEKALPEMIDKATNPELQTGFKKHLDQTRGDVARVEEVFDMQGSKPRASTVPTSTAFSRKRMR